MKRQSYPESRFITLMSLLLLAGSSLLAQEKPASTFPPDPASVNLTPHAVPQAEAAPYGSDPFAVIKGQGWQNTGPTPETDGKKFERPPISNVHPSFFILTWQGTQTISAVRIRSNADKIRLASLSTSYNGIPAMAPSSEWMPLADGKEKTYAGKEKQETVREIILPAPEQTRAIRMLIESVQPKSPVALIYEFSAWGKPSSTAFEKIDPLPPVRIAAEYPGTGTGITAMVINDAKGNRVRNLFAQEDRNPGKAIESWDLKDENGNYVEPGTYQVKFTFGPQPDLLYQMTPYPNVEMHSPQSTPWQRSTNDCWLANHGNQCSACFVGKRLFISAGGTEGGHALLECDTKGQKLWGSHQSAMNLFTDGKTLFLDVNSGIRAMDPATKQIRDVMKFDQGPERKGKVVGTAAKDNKIYVAYHSPLPITDNATRADVVDLSACLPALQPSVKRSDNYGIPLSPQNDFLSFFRLRGNFVAGDARNTLYIETTKGTGPRQNILLAFNQPVPIGSLIFPRPDMEGRKMAIRILKPDAPYPPDLNKEDNWTEIPFNKLAAWDCIPLPEKTMTRALWISFSTPDADLFTGDDSLLSGKAKPWFNRIEGMRMLRARFKNVASSAKITVNSGTVNPSTGEWDAQRTEALSVENPGIMLLSWAQPQKIRALALKEVDGELMEIDAFKGKGAADMKSADGWEKIGEYKQHRRNHYQPDGGNNADALYLDSVVEFDRVVETTALRLRVVKQWGDQSGRPVGVRRDRGGSKTEPARCRIHGVAALEHLGNDNPLDPIAYQRLATFDAETGKLISETPSAITGRIAFRPTDGVLFGFKDGALMRVADQPANPTEFITDFKTDKRSVFTFDPAGNLYVWDDNTGKLQVRAYDANGKFLRTIGKPGSRPAGIYDPTMMDDMASLAADADNNLICVYPHDNPKRVAQFTQDGKFVQDFYGNPNYGGGGVLDPYDKTRLYWGDVRFKLDWDTGYTSLDSVMSTRGRDEASVWGMGYRHSVEPIMISDRRYLVQAPLCLSAEMDFAVVSFYDEAAHKIRQCAAVGSAAAFPYLERNPDFMKATGGKPLSRFSFIWTDRNADEMPQTNEVTFTALPEKVSRVMVGRADSELGFWARTDKAFRYEVKEYLPDGTPVYQVKPMTFWAHYHMPDGNHFRFSQGLNEVIDSKGQRIWAYKAGYGMQGLFVPPWKPGRVDLQFGVAGFGKVKGDLGDVFVIAANNGQWNLWTADGLLAGHVTFHQRDPRTKGWPAEHARGTSMGNITVGQEHFRYWFCQAADGKFYIVAGGLSCSVMEVAGLEKIRRGTISLPVTPELIQQTRAWEAKLQRLKVYSQVAIQTCSQGGAMIDGSIADKEWSNLSTMEDFATFGIMANNENLSLLWTVKNRGPMKNNGDDFRRYFKTGAAVDLQIGTNADADQNRKEPAAGDIRLLITRVNDKPVAVLYRPIAPGAPKDQKWSTSTPAGGEVSFDQVTVLSTAQIAIRDAENQYTVEASIPLKDLGLEPDADKPLKMDWGVMVTDDGATTRTRQYWANPMAVGVADEPTEARMDPSLWGHVKFLKSNSDTEIKDNTRPGGKDKVLNNLLKDLL